MPKVSVPVKTFLFENDLVTDKFNLNKTHQPVDAVFTYCWAEFCVCLL